MWVGEFGDNAVAWPWAAAALVANIQAWLKDDAYWCWWVFNLTHGQSCTPGTSHICNNQRSRTVRPADLATWTGVGYLAVIDTMLWP